MKPRSPQQELKLLIQSRYPILYVETWEEERVEALLQEVAAELEVPLYVWTVTRGLVRQGMPNPIYQTTSPLAALNTIASFHGDGIFLLKDFHRHWQAVEVVRMLRDLEEKFQQRNRAIVVTAPTVEIPLELEKDVARFVLGLPGREEFEELIDQVLPEAERKGKLTRALDREGRRRLAQNLSGLTREEARRVLLRCLLAGRRLDEQTVREVSLAKREEMSRGGVLEFVELGERFAGVGDVQRLKQWLEQRRGAFSEAAGQFGLEPPRGILLLGVQGCGKSLLAKAVAFEWQIPLVRLDPGRLYDKYIGESERRLRQTLEVASRMAPLVLWIDEIEKGFATAPASARWTPGSPSDCSGPGSPGSRRSGPRCLWPPPAMTSRSCPPNSCARAVSMRSSSSIFPIGRPGARSSASTWRSASAQRRSSISRLWPAGARASAGPSWNRPSWPLSTPPSLPSRT